jgi:hypothetical protein
MSPRMRGRSGPPGSGLGGTMWFGGWLFTLAFVHLGFWKGVLALVLWPYFLGQVASAS